VIHLVLALVLAAGDQSNDPYAKQGIAIAERFVEALKGTAEFHDEDFVKPLAEADKAALRVFGKCKMKGVGHMLMADPKNSNVLVRQFNDISVRMNCKGARWDMPVGLSLHLEGGKIARIETHNADLMRAD
jgi:hypothetical protein